MLEVILIIICIPKRDQAETTVGTAAGARVEDSITSKTNTV